MFNDLRRRSRKAGLPPGTLVYTGSKKLEPPSITLISYSPTQLQEKTESSLEPCLAAQLENGVNWINITGLSDINLIKKMGEHYQLHPLVMEAILNTGQRAKLESFEKYVFIVMKMIVWDEKQHSFATQQLGFVLGNNYLLTFQESNSIPLSNIQDRLRNSQGRVREQGSDYLLYTIIDAIVDQYFVVLDKLGDQIEAIEEIIITNPTQKNIHLLYKIKRQIFLFRKLVWPVREIINHLLQTQCTLITDFTIPYLRDIYDHSIQVLDTTDTFRDILAGMLDVYLSSLTNRINEIMKVLTIIATIFIPLTFIASIYGMNFNYMPELHWHYAYPAVLIIMFVIALIMLYFFRRNKWL